jgi:hypothetical protein
MAPPKIKRNVKKERDLIPPPRQGLGSFNTDPNAIVASSSNSGFTMPALDPLIPDPAWKQCEREDRHERVKIKEQAAKKAVIALKKMSNTLKLHLLTNPACQPRIEKIRKFHFRTLTQTRVLPFLALRC